jgi:hypothetical protein
VAAGDWTIVGKSASAKASAGLKKELNRLWISFSLVDFVPEGLLQDMKHQKMRSNWPILRR